MDIPWTELEKNDIAAAKRPLSDAPGNASLILKIESFWPSIIQEGEVLGDKH